MRDAKKSLEKSVAARATITVGASGEVVALDHPKDDGGAEPKPYSISGVPPGDILESLLSDAITSTQTAIDVACEGSSNLTEANAIRIACFIGTIEANKILNNLRDYSHKSLRVRHRGLLQVWPAGVARMTSAVRSYEDDPSADNTQAMARAVIDFVTISHKVLSAKTAKPERDQLIADYLGN